MGGWSISICNRILFHVSHVDADRGQRILADLGDATRHRQLWHGVKFQFCCETLGDRTDSRLVHLGDNSHLIRIGQIDDRLTFADRHPLFDQDRAAGTSAIILVHNLSGDRRRDGAQLDLLGDFIELKLVELPMSSAATEALLRRFGYRHEAGSAFFRE